MQRAPLRRRASIAALTRALPVAAELVELLELVRGRAALCRELEALERTVHEPSQERVA
jgi:hypothetical protein